MSRYLVDIEETPAGFSAYSPDVPGCVTVGESREAAERSMREAIAAHLDQLREDGHPLPKPSSSAAWVDVAA